NSGLAIVPNDPSYSSWTRNLFFQRDGGSMVNFIGNESTDAAPYVQGLLGVNIPDSAAIGAFSLPSSSDPNQMNTYVASQTASGDFEMRWSTGSSGWQGPKSYPALSGADKNTNIACLTPNAFPLSNLQPKYDMTRCYFQAGGLLREVRFDGNDWVNLGNIPMT